MTHQLLNTLFVTLEGSYLRLEHDTVRIEHEEAPLKKVPLHHIGAIVLFGNVGISPFLLHRCADDGRTIVWMDSNGRFKARMEGAVSGNVLLRRAQHETLNNQELTLNLARRIVAGKLHNARYVLMRAARENPPGEGHPDKQLSTVAGLLADDIRTLSDVQTLDELRGIEGRAAKLYFEVFDGMIRTQKESFRFSGRNRRPPRDRVNALLSFLYALLSNDCRSALESVGLDPQVGFLHAIRPGRPALALDLMEEFRTYFADRLALKLINLKQIEPKHFDIRPGDAILLNDEGRKEVIVAYQKRKQEEVTHPVLRTRVPLGLVLHVQARLLARVIRGDLTSYTPFLPR